MKHCERVLEVDDGEDEAEELPESDHQGHGEAGALCGQHKHWGYANVLGDNICKEVEEHHRDLQKTDLQYLLKTGWEISVNSEHLGTIPYKNQNIPPSIADS